MENLPDSPCVALCNDLYLQTDQDRCRGCGRTRIQKDNWLIMNDDERRIAWQDVINQGWQPNRGVT